MTLQDFTGFLGWCSAINAGLLILSTLLLLIFAGRIKKLHAALFKLETSELPITYFRYLALYKVLIIVFNIVPYAALKIMA
ncbi:DUF6868 family protein [Roseibium litorale]|uniref:DUF6868 domain-containing protein n=1 Tax=Roseibium litorale TaxID=2803841 RepID=A0ABR9CIE3_9HYPH|nr:hypothetical protein [Roseibium litorale]MBD8890469.1 hypothetical protein [Roseibium litorale]